MHVNTINIMTISIATSVRPTVNHKTTATCLMRKVCKRGSKQPRTYYQIVKLLHEISKLLQNYYFFYNYCNYETTFSDFAIQIQLFRGLY